ncbi:hypothetical protein A3715_13060 [Oleiphilus sp. HI0009]|uniref:efflux RND transporter periplasmic adaptor subunit n=2 Tax=Oleiphilus TaxID=141450 RepID=UPI0007C1FE25|nr:MULTISPECIES: efflux RND transporter periplasmic adaptor subunit [unclassified Oleiphilus]KZX76426.1 hypothetical protein A3715_13060 [Oleiphilus sp. HI0009]KZY65684.1 hypothetical protein A3738_08145 [Oleiphilus sp. HI0066]KZY67622.1 hypothetical protein A3739_12330 [Oleiphilus sp. HI0067]
MNRSVLIALGLSIAVLGWLFSGSSNQPATQVNEFASEEQTTPKELFKVTVRPMVAETVADIITLQGDIEPARAITVKAETHGSITNIGVESGTRVQQNQVMLNIDISDRQARLEQAQAELKLREAELKAAQQLKQRKLVSGNQLEQALANLAAAKSSVEQITVELGHTRIRAAFEGIANYRHVELGDYVQAGDPLIDLIDDQHIKIIARVPQQHVSKIKLGQTVNADLLDGTTIEGQLSYISSQADPATRTFRIEATAQSKSNPRLGQSARVRLQLGDILAHKVSSSILSLAADGSIYVNAVDESNQVVRYVVEIIKNDSDGVWLSGLPENLNLIVVGQAFVAKGQTVDIAIEGQIETNVDADTEVDA